MWDRRPLGSECRLAAGFALEKATARRCPSPAKFQSGCALKICLLPFRRRGLNSGAVLLKQSNMKKSFLSGLGVLLCLQFSLYRGLTWDYEVHRAINQVALACLPTNFPAFVRTPAAEERIAFLAGEPDRWYNTTDLPLKHANGPDHYIDLELLEPCGLSPETLPMFRYDFTAQLAAARAAHPEKFPPIDETKNADHTRQLIGFLPWAIVESDAKIKSSFSYLKAYEADGTPEEVANAQQNILYVMGVLGHLVGDATQPLHTTIHHHGWVGDNPHGYTTNSYFHRWIDGDYFIKTGGVTAKDLQGKARPARALNGQVTPDAMFRLVVAFIVEQHKQVEPLYQLDKEGKLSGEGERGLEGKAFLEGQLAKAGQMLADLWYTAYVQAPPDTYLKTQLQKRKAAASAAPVK
jgi:hypothetical protein